MQVLGYNGRVTEDYGIVASLLGDRCELDEEKTLLVCADQVCCCPHIVVLPLLPFDVGEH